MIDPAVKEILASPPDSALCVVSMGREGPHVVNSWNSYVLITGDGRLLLPAGRMRQTEENLARDPRLLLTVANRELPGRIGRGTGFLLRGRGVFLFEGEDFDAVRGRFPWARAALSVTVDEAEQTL